jgi:hypothetical protein
MSWWRARCSQLAAISRAAAAGAGPRSGGFVSISVTSMSDVDHDRAGVASGMITTAHELGGAAGVSLFSAVAFGAGGATRPGFVTGYAHGTAAGAAIAAVLALVAVVTVPQLRPTGGQRVALH